MKIAIIPSDSLEDYEVKGISIRLEDYYNPLHFFDEVFLLSPKEKHFQYKYGMTIIPTQPEDLINRLKELKIDIIRAYGGYWATSMACINKTSGIPVVASVHDTNPLLLFDSIKYADIIFCVSKAVKNDVLKKYKNYNRVWILPNRVDFNIMKFRSSDEISFLSDEFPFKYKILHIGRKTEQKNLDTLIKALSNLGKDFCLLTIGKGDTTKYKYLARQHNVIDQCFFKESVKSEELSYYFSWADCFCTPSRWEGFGIVFIEALACESIVVTSDIGPMNEFIEHKYNGILVKDYENPETLAEMIKFACCDQDLRKVLKKNARKSVMKFEKHNIDTLEVEYYRKILNMEKQGLFPFSIHFKFITVVNHIIRKLNILFGHILDKFLKWNFFKNFNELYLLKEYIIKAEYLSPGLRSVIYLLISTFLKKFFNHKRNRITKSV